MSNEGSLVVIAGPSGVGKTTLCRGLVDSGVAESVVTCTTRAPREGEVDGVHYNFLDEDTFATRVAAGDFVEHATVHGRRYGILRETIESGLAAGRRLLLNIDVQGAATLRGLFPGLTDIFVTVSDRDELRRRLEDRSSDDSDTIESRLAEAEAELARRKEFSHVVANDDLDACLNTIKSLILESGKEHHV